jgi:DNA-binding XRE family transcriptional regulator
MNQSSAYLSTWLKENGILRGTFARTLGISAPTMSRILRGQQVPTIELAIQIETMTHGRVSVKGWAIPFQMVEAAE